MEPLSLPHSDSAPDGEEMEIQRITIESWGQQPQGRLKSQVTVLVTSDSCTKQ